MFAQHEQTLRVKVDTNSTRKKGHNMTSMYERKLLNQKRIPKTRV
ncbi:hypothetical protein GCM10022410_18440 [Amphibacillus indicireducens]|uniref:Uncharacterized protein n=1 Tax=Amphibacillus indicireducens TaxID=1076330 RepID=A0ABP7VTU3_9BACI